MSKGIATCVVGLLLSLCRCFGRDMLQAVEQGDSDKEVTEEFAQDLESFCYLCFDGSF